MPQENGNVGVWKFSPVTPFPPFKNLNAFQAIQAARAAGDLSTLEGEPKVIAENIAAYAEGDTTQWGWEKIYGVEGVYNVLEGYQANDQLMVESFVGAPTPTMVERRATLEKLEKEVFVKIIMGAAPIEEFDKFVEDWNKLGGEDMTNEVNAWYDTIKDN
jgi:putative aldouronate transport system substrate-binding protein